MPLKQRIEELIKYYDCASPNDFAVKIGIRATKIYYVLEGKTKNSHTLVEEIANSLQEINREWLKTGKGEMLKTPTEEKNPEDIVSLKKEVDRLRKLVTDLQAELLEIYKKK
jgi:predicted transcriptional regulator